MEWEPRRSPEGGLWQNKDREVEGLWLDGGEESKGFTMMRLEEEKEKEKEKKEEEEEEEAVGGGFRKARLGCWSRGTRWAGHWRC